MSNSSRGYVCLLLLAIVSSTLSYAVTPDRIAGALTAGRTAPLQAHVHRLAVPKYDQGPVDPAMRMVGMKLLTTGTPSQQKALTKLLADQQDRKSPNYHRWLTPEQVGERFGLSQNDLQKMMSWLKSQGFTNISVARTRNWISFDGTAAQVQSAFGSEIHRLDVDGELHYANMSAPSIPAAMTGVVRGIRGLHDFRPRRMSRRRARPDYNSSSFGPLVAPGDIATMYSLQSLYDAGIDGTGQLLAVAGQTDIFIEDINFFRSGFGLSSITGCTKNSSTGLVTACNSSNFQYILLGTDPNHASAGDLGETDLDLEWTGAVARGAQIIYINGETGGGAFDAYYDAIDNNRAPVISLSYGLCESDDQPFVDLDEQELAFGNTEGITILNSSGDSGVAQCDYSNTPAQFGLSVNYPASSPSVTSVGGTAAPLANLSNTDWGTTNGGDGGTLLHPIPEQGWNDDDEIGQFCQQNPSNTFCTGHGIINAQSAQAAIGISSTGGGPSNCATVDINFNCTAGFAKPAWQTVTVAGQSGARLTPDVSVFASPNFPGYIFCTQLSELGLSGAGSSCANGIANAVNNDASIIGGTSASAPVMAGIVILLNQYLSGDNAPGLGNINPRLYTLAHTPSNGAFTPVTTGNILVYCTAGTPSNQPVALRCPNTGVFGFQASTADAATGYNLVTGLGSVNGDALAAAWDATRAGSATLLTPSTTNTFQGNSVTLTAAVTPASATGNVIFKNGTTVLGTVFLDTSGNAQLSTTSLPVGDNSVTASYGGNGALVGSVSTASTVTVVKAFTLTRTADTFPVAQGGATDATITLTFDPSFSGTVTFSCSDTASESTCTAPPSTNVAGVITFHITTTAPAVASNNQFNPGTRLFYAALLPGLVGIVFTFTPRGRSSRAVKLLSFVLVLGFSTLWLGSCGGSSSAPKDPGTPKGSYNITARAASGGATDSTTFTLLVQ